MSDIEAGKQATILAQLIISECLEVQPAIAFTAIRLVIHTLMESATFKTPEAKTQALAFMAHGKW